MEYLEQEGPENNPVSNGVEKSGIIKRDTPEPEQQRALLVKRIISDVKRGKKHHKDAFDRMRKNMDLVVEGRDTKVVPESHYNVNLLQRHVQQRTSALYAKNPTAISRRRPRLDFAVWDENPESLMQAQNELMLAMETGVEPSPDAMMILQDYEEGSSSRDQLDKISKTLEILFEYNMSEQVPGFKSQMKQCVRRSIINGVGYVKLGFQREMERKPEVTNRIADATERLTHIERLAADVADGEADPNSAEVEELKLAVEQLQKEDQLVVREGLTFDFPRSTSLIPDPACSQLRGFVGAEWLAEEFMMSPDTVKQVYNVDIGRQYTRFHEEKNGSYAQRKGTDGKKALACVWEYYDRRSGLVYVVADGYSQFLKEPTGPNISLERVFPFFVVAFNETESEKELFPRSDIDMLKDIQSEYHRSRQGLREHRRANRPKYAIRAGAFSEEDIDMFKSNPAHSVFEVNGLAANQKVSDVLEPIQTVGIDQNLYATSHLIDDMQMVVGAQEATLGGISGGTATETSIAESSRMSSLQSNVDDLDEMLTSIARAAGQVMLSEIGRDQAMKIAGPGAVWPELSSEQIAEEIFLEIEAGSSGRPNKAQDLQNLQVVAPFLVQIPGIPPQWLAKLFIERLDDTIDITDAYVEGLPSIVAMNGQAAAQANGQGPDGDPSQQGAEGSNNAPKEKPDPSMQPGSPGLT